MPTRHHFVPKSYLKQFTKDEGGFFYQAIRGGKRTRRVHVNNVCYLDNFYEIKDPEIRRKHYIDNPSFIELFGFPYENYLNELLQKFKNRDIYLSRFDHERLINIYLNFKSRTKAFRKNFQDLEMMEKVIDKEVKDFAPVLSQFLSENKYLMDTEKFFSDFKSNALINKELHIEHHLRGMLEHIEGTNIPMIEASWKMLEMNTCVLVAMNSDDYFITSDNPGFSLDGNKIFNTRWGQFTSVGFPINSKQMLWFYQFDKLNHVKVLKRIHYLPVNSKLVNQANYCALSVADEKIFSENMEYLNRFINANDFN